MDKLTKQQKKLENILNDPQKQAFLEGYYNPVSDTFGNKYRSALNAGYSESYARIIGNPSINTNWIKLENYAGASNLSEEHVVKAIERVALRGQKDSDKIAALKLLSQLKGMLVEKSLVGHVNYEDLINDLK